MRSSYVGLQIKSYPCTRTHKSILSFCIIHAYTLCMNSHKTHPDAHIHANIQLGQIKQDDFSAELRRSSRSSENEGNLTAAKHSARSLVFQAEREVYLRTSSFPSNFGVSLAMQIRISKITLLTMV